MEPEPLPRIVTKGIARRAFWVAVTVTLALDMLTKWLCMAFADGQPGGVWMLTASIGFIPVVNHGAAFSMMGGVNGSWIILSIVNVALLGMLLRMAAQPAFAPVWWAIALVCGGALGNLADRLFFGHVRDFISVGSWPTFNVADIGITVGVGMLLVHLMRPDVARRSNAVEP